MMATSSPRRTLLARVAAVAMGALFTVQGVDASELPTMPASTANVPSIPTRVHVVTACARSSASCPRLVDGLVRGASPSSAHPFGTVYVVSVEPAGSQVRELDLATGQVAREVALPRAFGSPYALAGYSAHLYVLMQRVAGERSHIRLLRVDDASFRVDRTTDLGTRYAADLVGDAAEETPPVVFWTSAMNDDKCTLRSVDGAHPAVRVLDAVFPARFAMGHGHLDRLNGRFVERMDAVSLVDRARIALGDVEYAAEERIGAHVDDVVIGSDEAFLALPARSSARLWFDSKFGSSEFVMAEDVVTGRSALGDGRIFDLGWTLLGTSDTPIVDALAVTWVGSRAVILAGDETYSSLFVLEPPPAPGDMQLK